MVDAVFGKNMEALTKYDDEDESCDSDGNTEDSGSDDTSMTISTMEMMCQPPSLAGATKKNMILMRNTWIFQMKKQTFTETQRHNYHYFLS
jgi:hypothetical protein